MLNNKESHIMWEAYNNQDPIASAKDPIALAKELIASSHYHSRMSGSNEGPCYHTVLRELLSELTGKSRKEVDDILEGEDV